MPRKSPSPQPESGAFTTGRRGFLIGGAAAAAAAVVLPGGRAVAQTSIRAAVLEYRDPWTNATGLAELLRRVGVTVVDLDPTKPATEQGVDLIAFGTFTNNAPVYGSFIAAHAESLRAFAAAGGVVLDMAQSDQFHSTVSYLPAPLSASRNDADYDTIYPIDLGHPLVSHLRVIDGKVFTGRSTQIRVSWESLLDWRRMRVLLACNGAGRPPALLEGAHGRGRFLLTSLTIDKCYNGSGAPIQPAGAIADSEMFFTALASYVQSVIAGTAPAVVPTLQPIAGPLVGDTGATHSRIVFRPGEDLLDRAEWVCTYTRGKGEAGVVAATVSAANDSTVLFDLTDLKPDTAYAYSIAPTGDPIPGLAIAGSFRTSTPGNKPAKVVMGLGSCVWTETNHIWDRIREEGCEAFVMLGDTPYIDSTNLVTARSKQRGFLQVPQVSAVTSSMPIWATWDDHDFGGNDVHGDLAGKRNNRTAFVDYRANATFGHDLAGEQLTVRTAAGEGIYTSFRRGPVEFFLLDPRWFSRTEPSWADAAKTTAIGRVQWEWLQQKLLESKAPFKCLATGMVWDDKQNGESDDWGTYAHERDMILDFIKENRIGGAFLLGGDIHVSRALNYGHRTGYEQFWQFIVSPMHSSVIPSLNVPHPALVHSAVEPHVFVRLEVDSTVKPATLTATWINRDGERIFEVATDSDQLAPQDAWVAFEGSAEVVPGEASVITTSFTNNSTKPIRSAQVKLDLPAGWISEATTAASFENIAHGETVTTSWAVTSPANASQGAAELTVSATYKPRRSDGAVSAVGAVTVLPAGVIPRSRLSIAGVSSEETGSDAAANTIDGNPATFWHTRWSSQAPSYPHWIALDLSGEHIVEGLTYLPRQSSANGRMKDYEVYVSNDNSTWGSPVATGAFANGTVATAVRFAAVPARYVKLVGLTSQAGTAWGGAAELTIHGRR
ncbi:discoidin domain-containing protein [Microbacterium yannicii]|uniref:discoidin domain-containing protein n=1 Tax=Microbacterium yannicii TaxID=671622 RepID=UPI0003161C4B|nr:discoidin domain-containing protein [Microbacterium yannicii]